MTTYYINSGATGTEDGLTPANAWLHPDDMGALLAGDIIEFAAGSGPYLMSASGLDLKNDGSIGSPIIWNFHGVELTGGVNASTLKWNLSGSGTNEYYLTTTGDADPSLSLNECLTLDGNFLTSSAETGHTYGTVGSLGNLVAGVGDNDTLGFDTVYIRFDDTSPANHTVIVATIEEVIDSSFGHHEFHDPVFSYANTSLVTCGAANWQVFRAVLKYVGFSAASVSSALSDVRLIACIGYWVGHRFLSLETAGAFIGAYNCTDWSAHVFADAAAGVATGTVEVYNCVSANGEAGSINKANAGPTLTESGNHWYPRMTAASGALGYLNAPNWPTTAATDNPASAATTENDQANLVDPGFVANPFDISAFNAENFRPQAESPLLDAGVKWWTTNPTDFFGVVIADTEITIGAISIPRTGGGGSFRSDRPFDFRKDLAPDTEQSRAARFHARERRLSFVGIPELARTLALPIPTATIVNAQMAAYDIPTTFHTRLRITGATPLGLVFEMGSSTIGGAIWIEAAGIFASFGSGVAASDDAVVVSFQPAGGLPDTAEFDLICSVLPGNGKARLWTNGFIDPDGSQQAVNESFTSGVWSDAGDGSYASLPDGTVTLAVPVGSRIAPSDFEVIQPLSYFRGQLPQQFIQ